MLIRVCDHFKDNPKRIDKLIAIKGLPKEWIFREGPQGTELKRPWEADIDANIPIQIRDLCEPMYITQRFSPIQQGAQETIDRRQILGIRIDYNSEPGRDMWDRVERYVEETIPRDERIPLPVLCAKDEHSIFETYRAVRNSRGSLELHPSPIPEIDLKKYEKVSLPMAVVIPSVASTTSTLPQATLFKCKDCTYEHKSMQGIRMHTVKRHPKPEKAGVV